VLAATTSTVDRSGWNADSSNHFIDDGFFTHPGYGEGGFRYEDIGDTSRWWNFKIGHYIGGFHRYVFGSSTVVDTTALDYEIVAEN